MAWLLIFQRLIIIAAMCGLMVKASRDPVWLSGAVREKLGCIVSHNLLDCLTCNMVIWRYDHDFATGCYSVAVFD